jgi:hypothetical protein
VVSPSSIVFCSALVIFGSLFYTIHPLELAARLNFIAVAPDAKAITNPKQKLQ